MHDLAFVVFLVALLGIGFRQPFIFVLTYVYIDNVSPQRLTYYLLNGVPISLVTFMLAVLAWAFVDDKRDARFAPRQALLVVLLIYCGFTTLSADFPLQAAEKWGWVWKALVFAIFLPLTLRTRLRMEALVLFMTLSAGTIIIVGGIKTLVSGGGYGELNLMIENNTGMYEGSIISTIAITIIPLLIFLMRHGTIFPPEWRVKVFCFALIFACLLMPIGTQARTGLVCAVALGVLFLRSTKRPILNFFLMAAAAATIVPILPAKFSSRMETIKGYKADQSASTRIAVWKWTWEYAKDHPFGGGFDAFRQNKLRFELTKTEDSGANGEVVSRIAEDKARAYHSSYFEMLGEQGYPGLALWLIIHFTGLFRMEMLHQRYKNRQADDDLWIGALATALQQAHIVYLVGALFVGIALNPFVYMLVGLQIGLDTYAKRRSLEAAWKPIRGGKAQPI
jgi:probable O-glycosylation ligase (exosortase A-associated)